MASLFGRLLSAIQQLRVIDPQAADTIDKALQAADELSHLPRTSGRLLEAASMLRDLRRNAAKLLEAAKLYDDATRRRNNR